MQIKDLNKENLSLVEKSFYSLLGERDEMLDIFEAIKNRMGEDDVDFYKTMMDIYSNNGNLRDGYNGFIYKDEVSKFFDENKNSFLIIISDYFTECDEVVSVEGGWAHLGSILNIEKFSFFSLFSYLLDDPIEIKNDMVYIFGTYVINHIMKTFEEALKTA